MLWSEPPRLQEIKFYPEITRDKGWCWMREDNTNQCLKSSELADECVAIFLNLINKADKEELPNWDPYG